MAFDPNNTIREMRKLQLKMQRDHANPDGSGIDQDEALHMAALFESLDDHLSNAGHLPGPWAHNNNQIYQGIVQRPADMPERCAICSQCGESVALAGPSAVRKLVHHTDAQGKPCQGE